MVDLEETLHLCEADKLNCVQRVEILEGQLQVVRTELADTLDQLQTLRDVLQRTQTVSDERQASVEKLTVQLRWGYGRMWNILLHAGTSPRWRRRPCAVAQIKSSSLCVWNNIHVVHVYQKHTQTWSQLLFHIDCVSCRWSQLLFSDEIMTLWTFYWGNTT